MFPRSRLLLGTVDSLSFKRATTLLLKSYCIICPSLVLISYLTELTNRANYVPWIYVLRPIQRGLSTVRVGFHFFDYSIFLARRIVNSFPVLRSERSATVCNSNSGVKTLLRTSSKVSECSLAESSRIELSILDSLLLDVFSIRFWISAISLFVKSGWKSGAAVFPQKECCLSSTASTAAAMERLLAAATSALRLASCSFTLASISLLKAL